MQVIVNINGRDALPVRAIPFVGRWGWMTSPDGVAEVFSQEPTRLHQTRDQMGSRAASVSVRNREALAAYTLEDKLVRLMSPSEWDYYKIQLDSLPVGIIGSSALGYVMGGAEYVDVAFVSLFFLSPLWFWLALRLRGFIGWPRAAFAPADFITKDPDSD